MSVVKKEYFTRIIDDSDNKEEEEWFINYRQRKIHRRLNFKNEASKKGFLTRMDNLHEDDSYTKQLYILCFELMDTVLMYEHGEEDVDD